MLSKNPYPYWFDVVDGLLLVITISYVFPSIKFLIAGASIVNPPVESPIMIIIIKIIKKIISVIV